MDPADIELADTACDPLAAPRRRFNDADRDANDRAAARRAVANDPLVTGTFGDEAGSVRIIGEGTCSKGSLIPCRLPVGHDGRCDHSLPETTAADIVAKLDANTERTATALVDLGRADPDTIGAFNARNYAIWDEARGAGVEDAVLEILSDRKPAPKVFGDECVDDYFTYDPFGPREP